MADLKHHKRGGSYTFEQLEAEAQSAAGELRPRLLAAGEMLTEGDPPADAKVKAGERVKLLAADQ